MEIMLKCFVKVIFHMFELGKFICRIFFFKTKFWSVVLKFVKVYNMPYISYCIRMMGILGGSKSIAIVLPLAFMPVSKRKGAIGYIGACASLFHTSHLKRDLVIVQFITTAAEMCDSNKVIQ